MSKSHWYTLNHRARKQSSWLENDKVGQTHMTELLKLLGLDKAPPKEWDPVNLPYKVSYGTKPQ